jgi:DNA polymerase I-like protein with 3'-5' exonuclease and polymerase domains
MVKAWAQRELCRPNQPKLGANLLYDLDYLYHWGVPVSGPFYDVQVAEPLLNENRYKYSLDSLAEEYLGRGKETTLVEQACEARGWKDAPQSHLWELPPEIVGPYAEGDVDRPLGIFRQQKVRLEAEGLWDLFMLETRLIPMLLAMRQNGVRVDVERAKKFQTELIIKERRAQAALDQMAGDHVDIWAAASIAQAFGRLGLEYRKTRKTGAPSFTKDFLEFHKHPIGPLILEARKLDKLRGTFVEGHLLGYLIGDRIHCEFNQLKGTDYGTVTGRFSCCNPNLQQIPSEGELAPIIRSFFIPEEGAHWGRADYSQIEIRILAHYAKGRGAEEIRQAFRDDPKIDYHSMCAEIAGIGRKAAKKLNFGVVYGEGYRKLAHQLGLSDAEGKELRQQYYDKLPFLKETSNLASRVARERGYIYTILNRRRRFNTWEPSDWNLSQKFRDTTDDVDRTSVRAVREWIRAQDKARGGIQRAFTYKALNAVIQGSAADLMKKAMVNVWEAGICDILGSPLLTVHDEMDFSVPQTKEGLEAWAECVWLMETALEFRVPIRVDGELKPNWGQNYP